MTRRSCFFLRQLALRLGPALALGAATLSPVQAAPASAPDAEPEGPRRSITHSDAYMRLPAVRTPVRSGRQIAGTLQVSLALDAPRARSRDLIEERELLLRSTFNETLLIYAARLYEWGRVPDADLIVDLLQSDADRLLGEGRATVVLENVVIHAN